LISSILKRKTIYDLCCFVVSSVLDLRLHGFLIPCFCFLCIGPASFSRWALVWTCFTHAMFIIRLFPGSNKWLAFLRVSRVSSLKNIVSIHTQAQKYLIIEKKESKIIMLQVLLWYTFILDFLVFRNLNSCFYKEWESQR
jgi:hypothetical protein